MMFEILGALGALASIGSFIVGLADVLHRIVAGKSSHGCAREEVTIDSETE